MWAEADYLHPRALLGYFPCYSEGNDIVVLDPEDRETVLDALHLPAPAQGRPPLPGRLLPPEGLRRARRRRAAGRHRRRRGHRADGQARGRRASSPSSCSSTASACRPPRAWPSGCTGACATTSASTSRQGRRYSWGYPAVPDQSEHLKVEQLLDLSQIGMEISDGYAPIPEQSTLALDLPTTRRPATTACATAACCPTARPTTSSAAPRATPRAAKTPRRRRPRLSSARARCR